MSEEGLESVMEQLWERAYRYGYLDGRSSLLDDSPQEGVVYLQRAANSEA